MPGRMTGDYGEDERLAKPLFLSFFHRTSVRVIIVLGGDEHDCLCILSASTNPIYKGVN